VSAEAVGDALADLLLVDDIRGDALFFDELLDLIDMPLACWHWTS